MKRFRYELTLDAQRDMAGIYNYYLDRGEEGTGRRIVRSLAEKIRMLAAQGNSGVARDWILLGLRAFPFKGYCIYFRMMQDTMVILHIAHGRQDIRPEMFAGKDDD